MIPSLKELADYTPKQEDKSSEGKISKASSSSTSWSRLKDPRIVRVSRAFGGKDRHSKVCTVRGLRDRRVRLSVPTAIQLYDLQDRLGLNQPSKVVDWLLNAAKNDIDELPPLQVPPGTFSQFHQPMLSSASHGVNASQSAEKSEGLQVNWNDHLELSTSNYWSNSDGNLRDHMKSKEIVEETEGNIKESWTKRKQDGNLDQGHNEAYTSNNFFERATQSDSPAGMLNNIIPIPNPSFLRWDSTNLSRSHTEDPISQSTSLSRQSGSQYTVYPHAREFDPKQMFNFQMLSSSVTSQNSPFSNSPFTPPLYTINQATRPFQLSRDPYSSGSAPNKDD